MIMVNKMESGSRMHLEVKYLDGTKLDLHTIPFDTIGYERKYKQKFSDGQGSAEMMFWLAYKAGGRLKLITTSTFDAWVQTVEDVYLIRDEDEAEDATTDSSEPDPTPDDFQIEESPS